MKRLFVILVVLGAVTYVDRPPSRLHLLKGSLAAWAARANIHVVRDAKGRPVSYRFFTPDR